VRGEVVALEASRATEEIGAATETSSGLGLDGEGRRGEGGDQKFARGVWGVRRAKVSVQGVMERRRGRRR
jgi:hypothetical protein